MDARIGVDEVADLADLQGEGGFLEGGLHLARPEETQIASVGGRPALAEFTSDAHEVVSRRDLGLEVLDVGNGLILGASDGLLAVGVIGVPRLQVLLQDVAHADLLGHFDL